MDRQQFDILFHSVKKVASSDPKPDVVQSPEELWWIFSAVQGISPRVIVEVGTANGGTALFWEKALGPEGLLITIDTAFHAFDDRTRFCDFSGVQAQVVFLQGANSQSAETVEVVKDILQGRPVDFLYIDGDHSYEGVKTDYELWTPLVRPEGLVGFHDTNHPPIKQMLREKNHPRLEMMDRGFGTGLIRGW